MDFRRNYGLISHREQRALAEATVAIAGCGGDGGLVAETLARMGVGAFRLADPETFSSENLNRQNGCDTTTIGRSKAEVIANVIERINPDADVRLEPDGITADNVDSFVANASLVIDETEYTLHHLGLLLARAAAPREIPVLTGLNIGFGTLVTSFTSRSMTLDQYLGIPPGLPITDAAAVPVGLERWVRRLPNYVDLAMFDQVAKGAVDAPSVAPGVSLTAAAVATEAFNHLTGRRSPVLAPRALWVDLLERRLRVVRSRRAAFYLSLARVLLRTRLRVNEPMVAAESS